MKPSRAIFVLGLAAGAACLPARSTGGGILRPIAGTVAVNGEAVTAGSAVIEGDRVSTGGTGSARMVLPGGAVIAGALTQFQMENVAGVADIRLVQGMVQVSGMLPVALGHGAVLPTTTGSRFTVATESGRVYVSVIAGAARVRTGAYAATLHAGEAANFQDTLPKPISTQTGSGATMPVWAGIAAAGIAAGVTGLVVDQVVKNSSPAS